MWLSESKTEPEETQSRWVGAVVCLLSVLTVLFVISLSFEWAARSTQRFANDLAQALSALGAVVVTLALARSGRLPEEERRPWLYAGLAYCFFAAAQFFWLIYGQIFGGRPFPSAADVGFLAFYPLMLIALLSFQGSSQSGADRRKFFLDAATVMIGGSTMVWYFIVLPTVKTTLNVVESLLNVAYIVGDMILFLGIISILLRQPPTLVRRPLLVMVGGLMILFCADISFAFVTLYGIKGSGPLVALWVLGPFVLTLASYYRYRLAGRPVGETESLGEPRPVPVFSWMPYLAIAGAYGVLFLSSHEHLNEPVGSVLIATLFLTGIVVYRQITAVKENIKLYAERAARESESHFRTLIENSSDIVMIFDLRGRIAYQSPSVERILGYRADEILGTPGIDFVHPDDVPMILGAFQLLRDRPEAEILRECRFRHADGSWRVLEGIGKFITDESSGTAGILLNARDINERKALESRLKHQAFHDPLTNLANRLLLRNRVEQAVAAAAGRTGEIAVLFLDLDDFKMVNDTLGHDAGDRLLIELTERLRFCVRGRDTVARLGGDEFAILLEGEGLDKRASAVARRILESVRQPFDLSGSAVKVGISIGIAFNESPKVAADDLLRNADVAMYIAKGKGKNRYVVFEDEMHRTLLDQIELENDLRAAIEGEQLNLEFQPIVSLKDGVVTGMEALVRWHHPTRGTVPPSEFIRVAEQTGLIIPLGRWIMLAACRYNRRIYERTGRHLTVTINISGKQIEHPEFVDDLGLILRDARIRPESIILELTESTMMENTEQILKLLHRIKSLGIRLAIDDFGTGYSSLSYLQQFPIDILKIDRSFVDGVEYSPQKNAVARTIINLSDTLQLATVAEGVETAEQAEVLQALGCEFGQGYHFARPLTGEAFEKSILESAGAPAEVVRATEPELVSPSVN